jgi:hypothetical protein
MTWRVARVTALVGVLALLPIAPGSGAGFAHADPPFWWLGFPIGGPPVAPVAPGWPGFFGVPPPNPGPPVNVPGFRNGSWFPFRVKPPVTSSCQITFGARGDLVFTAVLSDGGRQDRGRNFEFGAVQDLLIEVRWHKLSAPARQRLELYSPDGHLFQMFTATLPADPEPVVIRVPVNGSWITSATLVGTWCAKVFLDDELDPAAADDFELKPRSPRLGTVPRRRADLARLALERTGRVRFRARGGSMHPSLRDGDVVSVARTSPDDIGIGDVVCYAPEPGRLTLHRVVGRDAACLVTKGDALGWVERVPVGRVLGKVTAVERRSRLARLGARFVRLAHRLRSPR